jgi:hypothetical protein
MDRLIAHVELVSQEDRHAAAVVEAVDRAVAAADSLRGHCRAGRWLPAYQQALTLQVAMTATVLLSSETAVARGRKVLDSAAAGGRARQQGLEARFEAYRREVDAVRRRNPGLSDRSVFAIVARTFGVSLSTIRRHAQQNFPELDNSVRHVPATWRAATD